MTRIQTIIEEINHLNPDELEVILKEIFDEIRQEKRR